MISLEKEDLTTILISAKLLSISFYKLLPSVIKTNAQKTLFKLMFICCAIFSMWATLLLLLTKIYNK